MAYDKTQFALSTIAMSVYNLIAVSKLSHTPDVIAEGLCGKLLPSLDEDDVQVALDVLVQRGWIAEIEGRYRVLDPKFRLVRSRSRDDIAVDKDGNAVGGWSGWSVQCEQCGGVHLLEDVISGQVPCDRTESDQ